MAQSILRESPRNLPHRAFRKSYFHEKIPVILTKAAEEWKAVQLWSPDYFLKIFPHKQIEIFHFQHDSGHRKRTLLKDLTISNAVDLMKNNTNPNEKYYILKDGIKEKYPELSHDFTFPRWISDPTYPQTNLWFGEGGNVTPLHYDTVENFLVQVFGQKQVRLYSSKDSLYLYPNSAQSGGRFNFSQINDIEIDRSTNFPLFYSAQSYTAVLEPGDILYIPPGWWHEVRTLDLSISLNFWFNPTKKQGPLWHLLGYIACRLYEGLLSVEESQAIYSCTWANALDTAELMKNHGQKWLAVLIAALWLENCASIPKRFFHLLVDAQNENNTLIVNEEVTALIEHGRTVQKLLVPKM